jgi:hypothetical protein
VSARILVTGTSAWRDGTAIRSGLRWMLDRYGRDRSQLFVAGYLDGVPAIARRAWAELAGVDPAACAVERQDQRRFDDKDEQYRVRSDEILDDARPHAVLVFIAPHQRKSGLPRHLGRAAQERGIPVWRWSVSLARPVEFGVDVHGGTRRWQDRSAPDFDD